MVRTSSLQYEIMVEFMERNGDLLRPQMGQAGRLQQEAKWRDLLKLLNADGRAAQKSLEGWKKVWSDIKSKTKKKLANNNREADAGADGDETKIRPLSQLEERILAILGITTVSSMFGMETLPEMQNNSSPTTPASASPVPSFSGSSVYHMEMLPSCTAILSQEMTTAPSPPYPTSTKFEPDQDQSIPSPAERHSHNQVRNRRYRRRPPTFPSFDKAVTEFARVENRRLQMEEHRNRLEHEYKIALLDMERKQLEILKEFTAHMGVISTSVKAVADILVKQQPS